tara:strand:- start:237 stop:767 length:531 start_codon:yes stop_codon:yes gene_type:complete
MAEKVGHTAAAVTKGGYFAELDKAIDLQKETRSGGAATTAVENFFAGKTDVNGLLDSLNESVARGEGFKMPSSKLVEKIMEQQGYNPTTIAAIKLKLTTIAKRNADALASAEQGEQIKTALMSQRAKEVPKLPDQQQTYIQRIAALREQHKRESGSLIAGESPEARITPAPEKLIG